MLFAGSKQDRLLIRKIKRNLFFTPHRFEFYKIALSHRTKPYFVNKKKYTNETLEFLGDAVLNLIAAHFLREYYPDKTEGDLSKMRSNLVSRRQLNIIAKRLHIGKLLHKSHGTYIFNNVLGNTLEAVFGAIFLDRGYKYAEKYFHKLVIKKIILEEDYIVNKNFKSILLEKSDKEKFKLEFLSEKRVINGRNFFKSYIFANKNLIAEALGRKKKYSEQLAAKRALKNFKEHDTH